jgi:hypothetical protein
MGATTFSQTLSRRSIFASSIIDSGTGAPSEEGNPEIAVISFAGCSS